MNEITKETRDRLNHLTEEFRPTHCSVTINPESTASLEDIAKSYAKAIEDLKEFLDSGHDPVVGERLGIRVMNRYELIDGKMVDTANP